MTVLAAISLLVTLAWGVGRVATDAWWWSQWLHWIPTVCALAVSIVSLLSMALARRRRAVVLFGAIALVQFGAMLWQDWHPRLGFGAELTPSAGLVRVVHFNANWPGASSALTAEALASSVNAALAPSGADVLFLSERGGVIAAAELLGLVPHGVAAVSVGRFGVVSRLPIVEALPLFDDGRAAASLIRFGQTEATPQWSAVLIDAPSDPHNSRTSTMAMIAQRLKTAGIRETDLLVGDFNAHRGGESLLLVAGEMAHAFDLAGEGWGGTFPRVLPMWHLDQMYCGDRVEVLWYRTIDPGIGKHRAQAAALQFRMEPPKTLDR